MFSEMFEDLKDARKYLNRGLLAFFVLFTASYYGGLILLFEGLKQSSQIKFYIGLFSALIGFSTMIWLISNPENARHFLPDEEVDKNEEE